MPELPEVEAVARTLRPFVVGRRIQRLRVIHPVAVRPSSGRGATQAALLIQRKVCGRKICAVERRGKYLLLMFDRGCLALHFRLDGQLIWFDTRKISGHVDVAFEMAEGTLGFVDPRHFGRIYWAASPDGVSGIRTLGDDPLSRDFASARLFEMLRSSRQPLKLFLLDQTRIAGLGNIYSNEAMWWARIDPRRAANRLTPVEATRLHKAIVHVLRRALECCLHPAPDFRNPNWWFQGLERILRVYGREGEKCRRCRRPIQRIEQGGRSTYWCARCQK
jgi:formamidopyrimidine-DNA glycosylase